MGGLAGNFGCNKTIEELEHNREFKRLMYVGGLVYNREFKGIQVHVGGLRPQNREFKRLV